MNYWLVKSEPESFSWEDMVNDGKAVWDGVRNYAARNHLKEMKLDDLVLFYHSMTGKAVVGYAKVIKEYYQDPTTDDEKWVAVELSPIKKFDNPVTLAQIKAEIRLSEMKLLKIGRLSVSPVTKEEFDMIIAMGIVQ